MVRIWNFDKTVTIQYNAGTVDELGGKTEVWTDLVTIHVMVMPLSASKQMQAAQYGLFYTHRFFTMYDDFWSAYEETAYRKRLRLVYDNKTYAVNNMENAGDFNKWLVFNCQELP